MTFRPLKPRWNIQSKHKVMVVEENCEIIKVFVVVVFVKYEENTMFTTLQFDTLGKALEKHAHL
jgi:hypothetical protein